MPDNQFHLGTVIPTVYRYFLKTSEKKAGQKLTDLEKADCLTSNDEQDTGTGAISGSYDVVFSALALPHSPLDLLREVFNKIFRSLKPRGMIVNADQILGRTPEIERSYERAWLRHARSAGCTEGEIEIAIERMMADRTSISSDQLNALESCGFESLNCWYQFYRHTTYSGIKPAEQASLTD